MAKMALFAVVAARGGKRSLSPSVFRGVSFRLVLIPRRRRKTLG